MSKKFLPNLKRISATLGATRVGFFSRLFRSAKGPTQTAVTFITKSNQKFWGASNR